MKYVSVRQACVAEVRTPDEIEHPAATVRIILTVEQIRIIKQVADRDKISGVKVLKAFKPHLTLLEAMTIVEACQSSHTNMSIPD